MPLTKQQLNKFKEKLANQGYTVTSVKDSSYLKIAKDEVAIEFDPHVPAVRNKAGDTDAFLNDVFAIHNTVLKAPAEAGAKRKLIQDEEEEDADADKDQNSDANAQQINKWQLINTQNNEPHTLKFHEFSHEKFMPMLRAWQQRGLIGDVRADQKQQVYEIYIHRKDAQPDVVKFNIPKREIELKAPVTEQTIKDTVELAKQIGIKSFDISSVPDNFHRQYISAIKAAGLSVVVGPTASNQDDQDSTAASPRFMK